MSKFAFGPYGGAKGKGWRLLQIELGILDLIQTWLRSDLLDVVVPAFTRLGNGGNIWIAWTCLLLIFPKTRRAGAMMAVSLALEGLCCNVVLKPLVARPRPFTENPAVTLLIHQPGDFSFPSGHTGAAFAAASALYFGRDCLWPLALVLAVLMGFSRLYLYVHFPSDVLAGALLGCAAGWLAGLLVQKAASGER